jgi:hypothetical protein
MSTDQVSFNPPMVRVPAEWEPHACCWMAWALHREWGKAINKVKCELSAVIDTISRYEPVCLLAPPGKAFREAQKEFSSCSNVTVIEAPVRLTQLCSMPNESRQTTAACGALTRIAVLVPIHCSKFPRLCVMIAHPLGELCLYGPLFVGLGAALPSVDCHDQFSMELGNGTIICASFISFEITTFHSDSSSAPT